MLVKFLDFNFLYYGQSIGKPKFGNQSGVHWVRFIGTNESGFEKSWYF